MVAFLSFKNMYFLHRLLLSVAVSSRSDTPILSQTKCRTIAPDREIYQHFTDSSTGVHSELPVCVFCQPAGSRPETVQRLNLIKRKAQDPKMKKRLIATKSERVICQVHFASGSTPGKECAHCGVESIMRRLYFTEQFHPACTRGGLSSESRLAFKCGKSAQSPPLTRNAAWLSSWCSLNKLNNEGISEMPKRHYTPTIRARSE